MSALAEDLADLAARSGFAGVVRVDRAGETVVEAAYGDADRAHEVPNTVETRFGLASITKGLTALVVGALVERDTLAWGTTARSLLGPDLPLVADDVTIEHLLAHRSGIGDYLDESVTAISDHVLSVPVHTLASTEDYLAALAGHATVARAGERFAYCNSGFVLLALLAERAARAPFSELVHDLVCAPAGMQRTGFVRTDALPGDVAVGYLAADGLRTNVLHLPVLGSGDGGASSTLADLHALWRAASGGRVVTEATWAELTRARHDWPEEDRRYALGFHRHATSDAVFLEGYDAGVSTWTQHQPSTATTWTVLSNWSRGAWPLSSLLSERL